MWLCVSLQMNSMDLMANIRYIYVKVMCLLKGRLMSIFKLCSTDDISYRKKM